MTRPTATDGCPHPESACLPPHLDIATSTKPSAEVMSLEKGVIGSETSARLVAAATDDALAALGFRDDDRQDVHRVVAAALREPNIMAEIERLAGRLRAVIGRFCVDEDPFDDPAARSDWGGVGVLPMLALLAVAQDVRSFHHTRGVSQEISTRTLSDLGQQAWVHRRTYGSFGLHTYWWLATAYSGSLYWLGRLQFNLIRRGDEWALATHIPESGRLVPEAVNKSFVWARSFFAEHFPDYPTRLFHCASWLLDPQLVEVLSPESNIARFQRLWALEGEPGEGDADAIFFVFRKPSDVDRSTLPRDTSLQRAILERLDVGGHWHVWNGIIDQSAIRPSTPQKTGS